MTPTVGLIAFAVAFAVPFVGMLFSARSHRLRRASDSARNMEERMAANWRPATVTQLPVSEPAAEQKLAA